MTTRTAYNHKVIHIVHMTTYHVRTRGSDCVIRISFLLQCVFNTKL